MGDYADSSNGFMHVLGFLRTGWTADLIRHYTAVVRERGGNEVASVMAFIEEALPFYVQVPIAEGFYDWCCENCNGIWWLVQTGGRFTDKRDAALFKLWWAR